jgi:hypothetical protein
VDLDEGLLLQAKEIGDKLGVSARLKLVHGELLEFVSGQLEGSSGEVCGSDPLSDATLISCFLSPQAMVDLVPVLSKPRPGCRLVSLDFPLPGVRHTASMSLMGMDIYIYHLGEGLERAA